MNVLITGASSGIGEALALECAKRGDRLFLCGRDRARLDAVAGACRAAGATVRADKLDVADEAAMRDWIVIADNIEALGSRDEGQGQARPRDNGPTPPPAPPAGPAMNDFTEVEDDELPF